MESTYVLSILFMSATIDLPEPRRLSIVDASELNYCVRNGDRWTLAAIDAD